VESDVVRQRIAEVTWFHTIDLGGGVVTPGATDPARNLLPSLRIPERLDGLSVLDVGAWDGFFSFEAERRGARRVLATDSYAWSGQGWSTRSGFDVAREALGSRVEAQEIDVMHLTPDAVGGTFDVVLCFGVLYHLRDPITALERVASVTNDLLILETELRFDWLPWPAARLYPGAELNGDGTNWWAMNSRALGGVLKENGFHRVEIVWRSPQFRRAARVARNRLRHGTPLARHSSRRVVIHAHKR